MKQTENSATPPYVTAALWERNQVFGFSMFPIFAVTPATSKQALKGTLTNFNPEIIMLNLFGMHTACACYNVYVCVYMQVGRWASVCVCVCVHVCALAYWTAQTNKIKPSGGSESLSQTQIYSSYFQLSFRKFFQQ